MTDTKTRVDFSPTPVDDAALKLAAEIYVNAKTIQAKDMIDRVATIYNENKNIVAAGIAVHCYAEGGGDVANLITTVRDNRVDPKIGAFLTALRARLMPSTTGEKRENAVRYEMNGGARKVIASIATDKLANIDASTKREREAFEAELGRKLTDAECKLVEGG